MTSDNFVFWLQGFFELTDEYKLTEKQVQIIKNHLQLVFTNVTSCPEEGKNKEIEKPQISKDLKKILKTREFISSPPRYC